jgi:hypothetical protein
MIAGGYASVVIPVGYNSGEDSSTSSGEAVTVCFLREEEKIVGWINRKQHSLYYVDEILSFSFRGMERERERGSGRGTRKEEAVNRMVPDV